MAGTTCRPTPSYTTLWDVTIASTREGRILVSRGRTLPFSFFPVTRGSRRYGLYDTVFAVTCAARLTTKCQRPHRSETLAFLEQAEDFYRAATANVSANPLLLYYAFMNLGKALIRVRGYGT